MFLPNILGRMEGIRRVDNLNQIGSAGALRWQGFRTDPLGVTLTSKDNQETSYDIVFNANASNPIYSDELTTIRPDALSALCLIRAYQA